MANRTMFTRHGLGEPGPRARPGAPLNRFEDAPEEMGSSRWVEVSEPAPPSTGSEDPAAEPGLPTPPAESIGMLPVVLDVPRPISAGNDTATALEDGPAVVISVLGNDVGVAGVARINGVAVAPGSSITLQSGARVIVNTDGTLSYEVGTAFQSLGAGQTAQDVFTYSGGDGGGSPLAPEGVFSVGAINGTNGFVIQGAATGDRSGYSVAGIGDINGDGRDDLLISALSADPTGRTDAGISYVVYGRQGGFGQTLDLAALTAAQGFAITGINAFDFSGASVSAAGDVNGDGLADFLIGAPWGEAAQGTNAGEAYLVFGRAGGFGAGLDLSTLDGVTGVTFRGAAAGDGLGFAVSGAGDINGDGFDDLILGAREADGSGEVDAGASYVVFGRAGGFTAGMDVSALTGANGFRIIGSDPADRSGYSVAAAGDVNGDGIDDLIIGAPQGDPGGRANAGEAYVVFGRLGGFGATLDLGTLSGTNGFTISGVDAGDHAGWSVASAGDLNGDGLADLVIGALYADPGGRENAGKTWVVFGRVGGFGANLDLSSMAAATGFTITGTTALNLTGHSVASAGDVNGDGIDDLLIGALYADGAGGTDAGETYVVFGRQGGFGGVLDLASLNGQTGFAIGGGAAGDYSGHSVAAAGDVNGDGFDDLVIGAPMASPSGRANAGSSYVLFGAANVTRLSNDATVTVTVTGTNDAPVITSNGGGAVGGYTIVENTTGPNTVTALDPDAGANLVYSIVGGADAALFTINAAGVVSLISPPDFDAPADQNGDNVYEVIVQVSDGTLTDTQTLNVTVTNANEAPVITSNGGGAAGGYTISENTTGPNTVTASDPDAGANLTYTIIGGADAALFTIDGTGVVSLINAPDFEAPTDQNGDNVYEVVVQVSDGTLTDTQTINVTVTNANEAPVITSNGGGPSAVVNGVENSTVATTVVAADPDAGASLVYSIITGRDGARFVIDPVTGVLTFVTAPDFEAPTDQDNDGVYEVDVQVSDGLGGTDVQTIFVNVGNANEAPVITSNGGGAVGGYTISENTTGPNTVTASDPDAASNLTYSIIGGADAALFTMNAAGVLSLINAPNFEAPADQNGDNVYEVIVQASDGTLTDTQTINVTVTNANEAPVITSGGGGPSAVVTGVENSTVATTVVAADPDAGASLTWSIITGRDGARFAIDPVTGVLTFVTAPDFENPTDLNGDGVYEVDVQVSDGLGGTDVQTIFVNVGNANEAPVITSNGGGAVGGYTISENTTGPNTVTANDPDAGTNLTYTIIGGADAALFTINGSGIVSLINAPNFEAPADQNGDNVYEVIVQASDGTLSDSQTINVTVTNANEAPVITSNGGGAIGGYTISENTLGPTTIVAVDQDAGTNLTYSIIGGADAALFTMSGGVLRLINTPDFEAPADQNGDNVYEVIVQASDGSLTDTQTINLTVTNANEAPVITSAGGGPNGSVSIDEGSRTATTVTAVDQDAGASLTYSISGGVDATRFVIDPATGVIAFVTPPDFEAPADQNGDNDYDIVVQVSDGVNTDTQTLRVTVNDVLEAGPPSLTEFATTATFAENTVNTTPQLLDADVVFSDLDGDYDGGSLTISGLLAEDRVSVLDQGSSPGLIGLTGSNVTYGGVVIGVVSGGSGSTLSITFNAAATSTAVDALIQNLTYANVSDTPSATRNLVINITDAAGNDLNSAGLIYTERSGPANPFDGLFTGLNSIPAFADLDGDGDLDAVVGERYGALQYFENTGSAAAPVFTQRSGTANPFDGVGLGYFSAPTFADLDGDGDFDAMVGDVYGALSYFENTGSATAPIFTQRGGASNPLDGVNVVRQSNADFADLDGDGDLDALRSNVAGEFYYFENTGTATAPVFTERTGSANPFDVVNVGNGGNVAFGDVDDDGDLDAVIGDVNGRLSYFENTGTAAAPTFTERTGADNPFRGAGVGYYSNPAFADLDGDGDLDVVVGEVYGALHYFELDTYRGQIVTVSVTAEGDGPVLTDVNSPVAINEGDPAVHIDADVTFTDSGVGYGGGNLTVSGLNTTDIVSVFNNGTGPGQIGLELGTVSFEGVDIGSVDATVPGAFVIRFTAAATRAAIEALVEALSYQSTSDVPVTTHALFLQITNANDETSTPATVAIQFTADILNGSAGDDILSGLRGNDQISGFGGMDQLSGGAGDDRISGGADDDTLDGGDADDLIDGGAGLDLITGGDGHDVLAGGLDNDSLFGEGGDDQLEGDGGDDNLDGGIANDWLIGSAGIDNLRGDEGLDRLEGGDDDDFLFGGNGEDILAGGIGIDDLQGEDGNDQLAGDGGDDRIDGGAGIDTAIFKGPISSYIVQIITAGVVQVTGPEGTDLVLNCEFLQFDDQTINLFGASNTPPRITSDGGGSLTGVDVDEGQTFVTTVVASDTDVGDTITYSIAGGADAALFAIDPATGVLTFIAAPDFEAPADVGRDNLYDVIVAASDGQITDLQGISVSILDIAGAPLPSTKGGGPEICYGPDDPEGDGPQVLPGLFDAGAPDKAPPPTRPDDLVDLRDISGTFSWQDQPAERPHGLADGVSWEPLPFTAWDDGFA